MGRDLTIEGERYISRFKAERRTKEFWGGSEYTEHTYDGYWYQGPGIIEDKKTGEKYFFELNTNHFRERSSQNNYSLEESIVNYNQKGSFFAGDFKPELVDGAYAKIVDMALGQLVSRIKESKEDIPTVAPVKLKLVDLVELGLCIEENGLMHLPMHQTA